MIRDNVNIPVEKMNLSFAGCGFLGIYHVGVASCFREYLPEIVRNKFSGASVGALVATAMALDCSLAESTSDLLKVAIKARSRALGPFHPTFDVTKILYDALVKALPHDAHKKVSGRLFISVTRVSDGKNKIISHFDSKDDLIQAIQCSCFIPCWSGVLPPKFHGVAYMDGGFSDNLPILNDYTVTVAPFAGESDICPQENTFNYMQIQLSNTSFSISPGNLYRITRILFPPHPEEMSKMCLQGFNDALKFLQRTNKISCLRCVAIQSSFLLAESNESEPDELIDTVVVEEDEDEEMEEEAKEVPQMQEKETRSEEVDQSNDKYETDLIYDDSSECTSCREMIDLHSLPDPVAKAIQEAIDSVNKGLINWIYKHRPVRVLSLLTIPFTLPFDLALIFAIKSLRMIPVVTNEFKTSLFNIIAFLLKKDKLGKKKATTRFSCQLAITEFGGKSISSDSGPSPAKISKPCKRKESVFNIESPYTRRKISTHDNSRLSPSNSRLEKSETLLSASSTSDLRSRLREETKAKRNSYAGKEFSYSTSNLSRSASCQRERRKTVAGLFNSKSNSANNCNLHNPQRMNFGFTVDLPVDRLPSGSRKNSTRRRCTGVEMGESYENIPNNNQNSPNDVLLTVMQSLEDGVDPQEIDLDAKEVTNKALSIEKEYFERFANSELGGVAKNTEALDKIMDVASNNHALMAFYYLDEKKRVKVTEIFSIPDACERDKVDDDVDDGIEIVDDDFRTRNEANTSRCCDNFIENDNQQVIHENSRSDDISEWVHFHGTDADELSSLQYMSIRSQSRNDFTSNNSKSNNNNMLG